MSRGQEGSPVGCVPNTLFQREPLAAGAQPVSCQLASVPGNGPGHISFSNIDAVRMSMRICISPSVEYPASFLRTELPHFPLARSSANSILKCPVFPSLPERLLSCAPEFCTSQPVLHCQYVSLRWRHSGRQVGNGNLTKILLVTGPCSARPAGRCQCPPWIHTLAHSPKGRCPFNALSRLLKHDPARYCAGILLSGWNPETTVAATMPLSVKCPDISAVDSCSSLCFLFGSRNTVSFKAQWLSLS